MKFWNQAITKPVIMIDDENAGLIIVTDSGVLYTNQVGGTACLHPIVEGVSVPLSSEIDLQLLDCLDGYGLFDEEQLHYIEQKILNKESLSFMHINYNLKSYGSWVHVTLKEPVWPRNMPELSIMAGFGNCHGILTWPNSD